MDDFKFGFFLYPEYIGQIFPKMYSQFTLHPHKKFHEDTLINFGVIAIGNPVTENTWT